MPAPKSMPILMKPKRLVRNGLVALYDFSECRNLLKYSQQFDNAAWTKTRSTIVANSVTAPDGTITGDTLVEDATAANTHRLIGSVSLSPSLNYTYSVYLKKGNRTWAQIAVNNLAGNIGYSYFDLDAGVVGSTANTSAVSMVPIIDGWYRCSITIPSETGVSSPLVYIYLAEANADVTFSGDPTTYPAGIYIWGAQLERGSAATAYYPTTDKQYLMDTSRPRKNLLLPNQASACEDGVATWFTKTTAGDAVTASTTQAWQGTYSAKAVCANAAASEGLKTTDIIYGLKPSTAYTASAYVYGSASAETVKIGLEELTDAAASVGVTYANLTLSAGWQRVSVSRTFGTTGRSAKLYVVTQSQQAATFYTDGLQLEEGASATAWEAPPNIGVLGSTTGADTNDPTWTGTGCSFTTDDYIACGNQITGGNANAPFTLQVVYAHNATRTTYEVIAGKVKLGANEWGLRTGNTNTVPTFVVRGDGSTLVAEGSALTVGTYYLASCIFDTSLKARLFVNLTPSAYTDALTGTITTSSDIFYIGRRSSGASYYFNGDIAYIAIYNRALTQAEITQNYAFLKSKLLAERGIVLT